jgi:hypothetical protein
MSSNLSALARDWLEAKQREVQAQSDRIKIEAQLSSALEAKQEGSITHRIDEYKVTLTQPVTRKVDPDVWASVENKCPVALRPIKTKIEPDASGIKWLMENEPSIWVKIAPAFESKKGKIGVRVEQV